MIKIESNKPDQIHYIVNTQLEKGFVDTHSKELIDEFIKQNSCFNNYEEYNKASTDMEFGEDSIKAFWYQSRNLQWTSSTIGRFEYLVNQEFKIFERKYYESTELFWKEKK